MQIEKTTTITLDHRDLKQILREKAGLNEFRIDSIVPKAIPVTTSLGSNVGTEFQIEIDVKEFEA